MTAREQGFLLLTSTLGDPSRKCISLAQFRELILRSKKNPDLWGATSLTVEDMLNMGYSRAMAERVIALYHDGNRLIEYYRRGREAGCYPLTLSHVDYPLVLHQKMYYDCPSVFWAKGDGILVHKRIISLVGSRDLRPENTRFAAAVGKAAAKYGWVLASGNARGADSVAQQACLDNGGQVICFVADGLEDKPFSRDILYLSEDSFDLPFSGSRALSRNRFIHCMGEKVFVAQTSAGRSGTWSGTMKNLSHSWTPLYGFRDGSDAMEKLYTHGVLSVDIGDLPQLLKNK